MKKLIAPALIGLAAFVILAAAVAGGYVLHHPATRDITRTVTVTKTAPAKTVTKTKTVNDPGLLRCAELLRGEVETYAAFEVADAGYPSAADGFNPPDSSTCGKYVQFGTHYALVQPPSTSSQTPPMPHVNGATHSELVNCTQAQCTTLPGAGPNGGTCGPVVNNEQECVW